MPSVIDQIQDEQTRNDEAGLAQAYHDNQWAQTFNSIPPEEKLRASRDLDSMVNTAIARKMELNAQHDLKSQRLYHNEIRFQHEQELQPLKQQLLEGRIAHETASTLAAGATERFQQKKDLDTQGDVVGFSDWMLNAPKPGTPEYKSHVLEGLKHYPRIITTEFGKKVLPAIAEENDSIEEISKMFPGFTPSRVHRSKEGELSVDFKNTKADAKDFDEEVKGLGLTPYAFENKDAWKTRADGKVFFRDAKHGAITLDKEHYDKLQGQYDELQGRTAQPIPAAPAAAPVQVDLKVLAQRALDDPNASEAHKARARQILGK